MNWLLRPWFVPVASALLALVLRVVYVLGLRSTVLFDAPIMDAAVHDRWARGTMSLLYEGIPYFRAPLYMWFLQAVYAFDESYMAPRLVQALLSAVSVGLLADAARRLRGSTASVATGLMAAFCWPVIYFSGELLIVTFFTFWVVLSLWCLLRATLEDRPLWAYAAAALLGLSSIARPTSLAMLPVLLVLAIWVWPRQGLPRLSRRVSIAVPMLVLILLPGLALTVRNQVVGHEPVFIASQGGMNFYIGNNEVSDGSTAIVPGTPASWMGGYRETIRQAVVEAGRPLSPGEISDHYYRKGLRFWTEQPAAALKLLGLKLRHLVLGVELSNNQNIHYWRAQSSLLRLPIFVNWAALISLGLVGIFLMRKERHAIAFWGFLVSYGAGIVVFFVNERFRMPLTLTLCLFAGIALARLVSALRQSDWRSVLTILVPVAVIFACTGFGRIGFRGDRIAEDAFSRYTVGDVYLDKNEPEEAIRWYREAYFIAQRYQSLGVEGGATAQALRMARAYAVMRDVDRLRQQIDVLNRVPGVNLDVLTVRGDYHRLRHEYGHAFELYEQVVQRVPDLWQAQVGIGWCYLRQGRLAQARQSFERALDVMPNNPATLAGLGALQADSNPSGAKRLLQSALDRSRYLPEAHEFMADIAATENDAATARQHYQKALKLDPHHPYLTQKLRRLEPN